MQAAVPARQVLLRSPTMQATPGEYSQATRARTSRTPSESNGSTQVRGNWSSSLVGEPKVSAVKIGSDTKGDNSS